MSEKLIGSCIFGQSGGPTSVINSSAYGVFRAALDSDVITNVYGAENGIVGVLNDRLFDISKEDPEELELLKNTPSSALGSCRYKIASSPSAINLERVASGSAYAAVGKLGGFFSPLFIMFLWDS